MRKAELEDLDWRMVAQDRGQWRKVVHRAAVTCSHPYPCNQGNKEERDAHVGRVVLFKTQLVIRCFEYRLQFR